jgi:hypothetical protein
MKLFWKQQITSSALASPSLPELSPPSLDEAIEPLLLVFDRIWKQYICKTFDRFILDEKLLVCPTNYSLMCLGMVT